MNAGNPVINGASSVSHQDDNSNLFFFYFAAIRPTRALLMEANAESLAQM